MEVAEFTIRELRSPIGLFKSGIDADAGGEEGRFHVWSLAELKEALTDEEFEFIKSNFNIFLTISLCDYLLFEPEIHSNEKIISLF
jgi:uncharacterized protein YyaL (SSP411 family)